jgi:hypothetical protein
VHTNNASNMSISALRKLLSSSPSSSSSSHASISTLAPHSGTRRDRVALFDRAAAFLSTGTSAAAAQTAHHDIATLLRSYLTQSKHAPILSSLRDLLESPVLNSIAAAVRRAPDRDKRQLTSLVTPHYHRKTLNATNFPISSNAYTTAQRHARTMGAGAPSPPPPLPPSKQPPSPAMLQSLATFLDAHSQPAACRTVKLDKVVTPARILSQTHAELHREWKKKGNGNLLSLSAFDGAIKSLRVYKPISKRATDMCDHCMEGRRHSALMEKRLMQHQQRSCPFVAQVQRLLEQYQATDDVPPLLPSVNELAVCTCDDVSEIDVAAANALLPVVCFYHHHRMLKQQRHDEYMKHQRDVSSVDGGVVITIDYKQNIELNVGPEEENRRFYHQAQRTVLGFLCQYKDRKTGRMVNHYIDYISSCLTHDATFVLECLRDLVTTFLLPRGLHTLKVWSDCGPHFRCYEMLAGVCVELPWACRALNVPVTVDLHYFIEKHGKSPVDGHFSLLSRWLQQAAAQHDIVSTEDLGRALTEQANSHLQAERSPDLPDHRCNFRFYTPFCQEHIGSYHESLVPPTSSSGSAPASTSSGGECGIGSGAAEVESSLPSGGDALETSMPVLDDDGDVQMTESQWASQPSEISFPPIASSPTTISLSPSNSLAQVNADGVTVAATALPSGKDECVVVCSDESVLSVTDERSAERGTSGAAGLPAAMHSRVEGTVKCTRPERRRPSIELPSSVALNMHYSWSCISLPDVTPPSSPVSSSPIFPSSSSSSSSSSFCSSFSSPSSSSSSSSVAPMEQVTSQEITQAIVALPSSCPVILSATVLPNSVVWPRQSVKALFRSELCTDKEYISFVPRLQTLPDVVVHPKSQSAVQKRLRSVHRVFSHMNAQQARSVVAALA